MDGVLSFCCGSIERAGLGFGSSVLQFLVGFVSVTLLEKPSWIQPLVVTRRIYLLKAQLGVATLSLLGTSETQEDLQSFI